MKTIYYQSNTINCSGKDYLIYWFYNWNEQDDCFIWDEDKLSFNEALEKYPQTEYIWEVLQMNSPSKMWQITELFEKIRWQSVGSGQYLIDDEQLNELEELIEEIYMQSCLNK